MAQGLHLIQIEISACHSFFKAMRDEWRRDLVRHTDALVLSVSSRVRRANKQKAPRVRVINAECHSVFPPRSRFSSLPIFLLSGGKSVKRNHCQRWSPFLFATQPNSRLAAATRPFGNLQNNMFTSSALVIFFLQLQQCQKKGKSIP